MSERRHLTPFGRLIVARGLPGLAAIALAGRGEVPAAGASLLAASLCDLLVDSWGERRGWTRTGHDVQLEGFVDFACFVWAPVQLEFALGGLGILSLAASLLFVAAGCLRLARFNVEGLTEGGYRGLPVTYAGVLVPLAALVAGWTHMVAPATGVALVFAVMAPLMASGRLITPRMSL